MKGSIRKKGKDSWQLIVDVGKSPDGRRQRYYETVRSKRKSDAQKRLVELIASLEKGVYTPPGRLTVADILRQWLIGYCKTNCSIRTFDSYESIIRNHLIPALGHIQLKQLHPQIIQSYYGKACEQLSLRTVHHHHRVLSESLKWAVRQGYLASNPCSLVDPPAPRKKSMRTFT